MFICIHTYVVACTVSVLKMTNTVSINFSLDENTDLEEIDEFVVYYLNSTMFIEVYHYPDDGNTDVIVVGKTSANNIPLPDVTSTMIKVQIASMVEQSH